MKILAYDFETSPIVYHGFGLYDQNIPHSNILEDWKIISGAWSWIDTDKIDAIAWKPTKNKNISPFLGFSDYEVVKKFHSLFMEADVLLAQNGDKFDYPKWNTRAKWYKLPVLPQKRSIDTLKIAKKHFKFTSNSLGFIGQYMGVGGKLPTTTGLWHKVIQHDKAALSEMLAYNRADVKLLKDVYKELLPYITNHPNFNIDSDDHCCPNCGSDHIQKRGLAYTRTTAYQRYQCQSCGSWHRSKEIIQKALVS